MASPSCNDAQLREKARKERERIAQTGFRSRERLTNVPEFGPIIKEPKANDALHLKIASVLGSYDDKAKAVIQESSFYLGVDDEAATPASPIVTSKGALPRLTPSSLGGKDLLKKKVDLPNGSQRPRNHESKTDFKALIPNNSSSKRHSGGRAGNGKSTHAASHNSKTISSPGAKNCQQNQRCTPPMRGSNSKTNASVSSDFHKQRTPTSSEYPIKQHCTPQNQKLPSPSQLSNVNQKNFPSALVDNHNQRTPPVTGLAAVVEHNSQQNQRTTPPNHTAIPLRNSNQKANIGACLDSHSQKMSVLSAGSVTHQCSTQKDKPDCSPRVQQVTKEAQLKQLLTPSPDKSYKKSDGHKSMKVRRPMELSVKNLNKNTGSDDSLDLEVIQEMTTVSTPVSDIHTPVKEECTVNLVPDKNDQPAPQNGASKVGARNSEKTEGRVTRCMSEGTIQLNADLLLSSSDSESETEQANQITLNEPKSQHTVMLAGEPTNGKNDRRQTNGIVLTKPVSHRQNMALNNDVSDSTSDSSSDGSDTDSSSSSSEEEDIDEHQEDQKKPDDSKSGENWNLKNWIPNTNQTLLPVDGLQIPPTKADIPLSDNNDTILDNLFATITTGKEVSPLDSLDTKDLDPASHELVDTLLLNGSGPKCDVEDLLSPIGIGTKSTSSQCRSSKSTSSAKSVSSSRNVNNNRNSSRTDGVDDATGQMGLQKKTPPSQKTTASHNLSYNGAKGSLSNKVMNSTHVTCNAKSPTAAAVQQSPTANKTKKTPTKVATKPAPTKRPSSSVSKRSASTKKPACVTDKEDVDSVSGVKSKGTSKANRQTVTAEKKSTVTNKTPVKRTNQGSKQSNSHTRTKKTRWKSKEFVSSFDSSSSSLSSSGSSSSHSSCSASSSSSSSSESSDSECELDQHAKQDLLLGGAQKVVRYSGRSLDAGDVQMSDHDRTSPAKALDTLGTETRPAGMCAINSNTSLDLDDELLKAPPQLLSPICPTPDLFPGPGLSPRLQASTKFPLPFLSDNKSLVDVPCKEDKKPSIMVHLDLSLIKHILHRKDALCSSSSVNLSNKLTSPVNQLTSMGSPDSVANKSSGNCIGDPVFSQPDGGVPMELVNSITNNQRNNEIEDSINPSHHAAMPSPGGESHDGSSLVSGRVKAKDRSLQAPSASPANVQHSVSKSKHKTGQEEKAVIASILGTTDRSPLSLTIPKRKLQNTDPDPCKKLKTEPKSTPSRESGGKHKESTAETADKRQSGGLRETAKSWGHIAAHFDENPHYHGTKYVERRKGHNAVEPLQYRLQAADYYLHEARRLKHEAEGRSQSRISKLMMYLEAVLSFVQCGYAMEKETSDLNNKGVFNMYKETFKFSRDILKGSRHEHVDALEYKLIVLSFRLQSLLCLKLFKLKKTETSKLKSIMDEYYRSAASKVPSPCPGTTIQARPGTTGTPSPMSQQSSPAGSINSVGSGGSAGSDHVPRLLNNGSCNSGLSASNVGGSVSNSTVAIPSRIHSVSQSYLTYMDYLYQCHEIWDQADRLVEKCKAFFQDLDRDCKPLSLHSSILEVVRYVKEGIHRLRQSLPPSSSSSS